MSVAGIEQGQLTAAQRRSRANLRPFKPGQSGNPAGPTRRPTFTELARTYLGAPVNGESTQTRMERLVEVLYVEATEKRNMKAVHLLLERLDPATRTIRKQDLRMLCVNIVRQGPEALDAQEILALPKPEKA